MRVGIVCPYSLDVHGGVQNHVQGLAAALHRLGHQAAVLAPGEPGDHLPAYVTATGRALAVPYNGSVARVSLGPLAGRRARRWALDGHFDILHVHEPAVPSMSAMALWTAGVPVVATYHTSQDRSRVLGLSAATVLRPLLAKVDAHIAVSPTAAATAARYLDEGPLIIPNGVTTALFRGSAAGLRHGAGRVARTGATTGAGRSAGPRVVFVGRVGEPRKGFRVLLDALPALLDRHPDARLVVVGEGGAEALEGAAGRLREHVDLRGAVTDAEKTRILAGADVVVASNTHAESFGIVLVEAMAAGRVVVASDLPAFRQVLGGGRFGVLVRPGDSADLARTIDAVLSDPARCRRLGVAARKAADRYDWAEVAPRIVEVYASVLEEADSAAAG